jgi:hypothetical protein
MSHSTSIFLWREFFQDMGSWTICPGWLQTVILLSNQDYLCEQLCQTEDFLSRLFFSLPNWKSFQNLSQQMLLSFIMTNGCLNHLSWVW